MKAREVIGVCSILLWLSAARLAVVSPAPARNRHTRPLRGPVAWPPLPSRQSPSQRFDALVLRAITEFEQTYGLSRALVEVAVEDVPPSSPSPWEQQIPLGRAFPGKRWRKPRIILYRLPIQTRCPGVEQEATLVTELVFTHAAGLLNISR